MKHQNKALEPAFLPKKPSLASTVTPKPMRRKIMLFQEEQEVASHSSFKKQVSQGKIRSEQNSRKNQDFLQKKNTK